MGHDDRINADPVNYILYGHLEKMTPIYMRS